jgi:hypothetical protein
MFAYATPLTGKLDALQARIGEHMAAAGSTALYPELPAPAAEEGT